MKARYYIATEDYLSKEIKKGQIFCFRTSDDLIALNSIDLYRKHSQAYGRDTDTITLFCVSGLKKSRSMCFSIDLTLLILFDLIKRRILLKIKDIDPDPYLP